MTQLSNYEKNLIQLICKGYSSRQIGQIIHKSPRTVEGYRNNLYEKLGLKNKTELIAYALKNGLDSH